MLWIYQKFYQGQEPEGVHERGQWLLKLYVEATNLLAAKEGETEAEKAQREAYDAERRELYRRWDDGDPEVRSLWLQNPRVEPGRAARCAAHAGYPHRRVVLRERSR